MLFRCNVVICCAVLSSILTGCSDKESVPAPAPAAAPKQAVESSAPVNATAVTPPPAVALPPPPSGNVAPAPAATASARNSDKPIVQGSKDDPNVLPEGFVPKAPVLKYSVNGQPNLEALSQALQVYCMWKKSVPADMQELVTSKFLPDLPALPAGKKYNINSGNLTVSIGN